MGRALQIMGLSGLFLMGVASTHAFAQDRTDDDNANDTQADPHHNTSQPKESEHPVPVIEPSAETKTPPVGAVAPAPEAVLPAAKPKRGDLSITGYFRGGFGAIVKETYPAAGGAPAGVVGGRMTCFSLSNPAGLVAKYRLGNECEVWSETHFTMVTYAGDDGVVSTVHFMPTIYIPSPDIGYSPNGTTSAVQIRTTATGATVSFPNLYVDIKGISWLGGGTAWAGTRYYKRESVYINDFFYWNPSGVGGGIEDIKLGEDLRLSYAAFAVDGEPQAPTSSTDPLLPAQIDFGVRNDLQLRGIKPWASGEFQIGGQYIVDYSNHPLLDGNGNPIGSVTHGGWGVTGQFVQKVLGGDNKLALQFGKGAGTGFGTLSRFYYPDFTLYFAPSQSRFRFVDVLTIQPVEWLGAQFDVIYQRDQNVLGVAGQSTDWYSAGGRVTWAFTEHAKLAGEIGYDRVTKSINSDVQELTKFTIAPTLTTGRGFMTRPELRLFYTYALWNASARGANIDSGTIYRSTPLLSGSIFGIQAETWY
jgi:maltoporin